ncbi:MAG TPA: hypothetical protein VNM48_05640 [Chloroflexota bacterium]|nr:hypothetical protein [Chloroflexota bacterium]
MEVTFLPALEILREIYAQPRDMRRFQAYVEAITGGTNDIVLPIAGANPMAKEHALLEVERLLAFGADEISAQAARDASVRLASVSGTIRTSLVLMDDVMGGWTNRYISEAEDRFSDAPVARRRIACGMVWTSEATTAGDVRAEMLGAIYRAAFKDIHGRAATLRAMLNQEGHTAVFAGKIPTLPDKELVRVRHVIHDYAAAAGVDDYAVAFACMYGDEGADAAGYPPLDLPPRAGFEVALVDALQRGGDPVAALR